MKAPGNIVIYEEDLLTRSLLEEWLCQAGYRVRVADRCRPGVDGPTDLVILSVYRPRQSGPECTREVRSTHAGTPVIAISGHFRPGLASDGSAARMLGVAQVVAKPLVREELLQTVRGILGR